MVRKQFEYCLDTLMFLYSICSSFNRQLLTAYYVLGTVLEVKDFKTSVT